MTSIPMQTPGRETAGDQETPRRRFMKAAVCAPALAIAGTSTPQAAPAAAPEAAMSGYRETDHIRRYYATAQY